MVKLSKTELTILFIIVVALCARIAFLMINSQGVWFVYLAAGFILALLALLFYEIKRYALAGVFALVALIAVIILST